MAAVLETGWQPERINEGNDMVSGRSIRLEVEVIRALSR